MIAMLFRWWNAFVGSVYSLMPKWLRMPTTWVGHALVGFVFGAVAGSHGVVAATFLFLGKEVKELSINPYPSLKGYIDHVMDLLSPLLGGLLGRTVGGNI